jgi:putative selenium metabolism hydrolase
MLYAAAGVDRTQLKGRIVISASTLEEVLEGVALKTVMDTTHPDFVVIGESTNLNLARGGRGRAEVHLKTIGRPSHSSAPELGRNAVLDMMKVIDCVQGIVLPEDPFLGKAIFALTDIISEPYPGHSVIPSICRVTYDRRTLAGETPESVLAAIADRVELKGIQLEATIGIGEYRAYTGAVLRCDKFFPAWQYDEADAYVAKALSGLHAAGIPAKTSSYRFCTNAAYSAGLAGVPTIGFGPATEADAHVIDEKLQITDLVAVATGYQAIIDAVLQ